MKFYETLYIVHPALESGRLKDLILGVEDILKKSGGNPISVEVWGKRKLSYLIDKQKYGTYVLVQFNGDAKCTKEFALELEHNPDILAYLTTIIEEEDVKEHEEDLETQIAGKTREADRDETDTKENLEKQSTGKAREADRDETDLAADPTIEIEGIGGDIETVKTEEAQKESDDEIDAEKNSKTVIEKNTSDEDFVEIPLEINPEQAEETAAESKKE